MKGICIGSVLCLLLAAGAHGATAQRRAIAAAAESQAGVTRHYDPSYDVLDAFEVIGHYRWQWLVTAVRLWPAPASAAATLP